MINTVDRSTPPESGEKISFEIPQIKVLELNNGIEIYFVQKDKLPIVQTFAMTFSGSRLDPSDKKGLAFLTSLLIDEGAAEYDALQLNNEIEKLGSVLMISSDHDNFSFSLLSLKENFERSVELFSKIILRPRFEEKDFNREKKKTLDRLIQLSDEPSFIASSAFEKQIFQNVNYAFPEIGYPETVATISNEDVIGFYKNFIEEADIKIVVVGALDENELIDLFEKYLSGWRQKRGSVEALPALQRSATKFFFCHKQDSAQAEIRIGHLSKNRNAGDFYSARIMNTILGGQFSSRINLNLRERRGFTYGAGSSFDYYKDAALFEVSTAVNIKNTAEAITEIFNELKGIKENISEEEINFAKSYLIKQFPSRFETYTQIAKNISPIIIHSLPVDYYNSYTADLDKVTSGEVKLAAEENIFPDQSVVIAVGDKKEILPQLKTLSDDIIELDIYGNRI
ncbi:MAG: insulinase family protein [Ignavibacteriales bacterium]|nr:insulinase family protein [Ignavibacteriales bacterium]